MRDCHAVPFPSAQAHQFIHSPPSATRTLSTLHRLLRTVPAGERLTSHALAFAAPRTVSGGASGTPVFSLRSGPSWGARAAASGEGEAAVEAGEASASASSADTLESAVGGLLARGLVDPPRSRVEALKYPPPDPPTPPTHTPSTVCQYITIITMHLRPALTTHCHIPAIYNPSPLAR